MFGAPSLLSTWRKFTHRSPLYLVIFVAIFLFIVCSHKRHRKYIITVFLSFFVLIFNPLSYYIIYTITGASAYRILWLFPAWASFVYILLSCLHLISSKNLRLLAVTITSLMLLIFCVQRNNYEFKFSSPYQIPKDTIELADRMEAIMDERGIDYAVLYGNNDFLGTLRQYSSRFILQISPRDHSMMEENAGMNNYLGLGQFITTGESPIDKDYASDILYANNVYFIVIHRNLTDSIDFLDSMGWYEIAGNDSYVVLCQDEQTDLHEE